MTLTHEKPNAERTATKPTKLPTLGGTLQRRISVDIPIVSLLPASWSLRRLNSCAVAIAALSQTVTFLTKGGRFRQAADREKEIAQIHIQEKQDLVKGCESYERAGEWYLQEDATAYAPIQVISRCCLFLRLIGRRTPASRMLLIFTPNWRTTALPLLVTTR